MKFNLEKQRRRARVLCNLSIELLNLCRDCQKIDEDTNYITMETLEETITNNDLDDLILNAIKSIRNNKKRQIVPPYTTIQVNRYQILTLRKN